MRDYVTAPYHHSRQLYWLKHLASLFFNIPWLLIQQPLPQCSGVFFPESPYLFFLGRFSKTRILTSSSEQLKSVPLPAIPVINIIHVQISTLKYFDIKNEWGSLFPRKKSAPNFQINKNFSQLYLFYFILKM